MSPSYNDGDFVISRRNFLRRYQLDDVVVVRHPTLGVIIKRIAAISTDYEFWLQGDNLASTNSAAMGWLPAGCILGKVFWHVPSEVQPSAKV
ncbi:hypothetical protein A3759_10130 [Thalassolituus sp. HI0120]|nr:hypothetical protein A3759_21600 [Thalassolituus sp. HI0120]KZZ45160.1 hypothetical protein A3759_10130 [Thalassolituus sp. HI0120]